MKKLTCTIVVWLKYLSSCLLKPSLLHHLMKSIMEHDIGGQILLTPIVALLVLYSTRLILSWALIVMKDYLVSFKIMAYGEELFKKTQGNPHWTLR